MPATSAGMTGVGVRRDPIVHSSSTNDFSRASASSHCRDTLSRYLRASSIGFGSSSNRLSRPARMLRTMPASSKTRRCLLTAWRDNLVTAVRREIDCGAPWLSLARTDNRVSSPSAAKTDARARSAARPLGRLSEMPGDVVHLLAPAAFVHPKGLVAARAWNLVEARLDDAQQRSGRGRLQREFDERRRRGGRVPALGRA